MGLFQKRKNKIENVDWNDVYYQSARFVKNADGGVFGVIVLNDNTKTAIAKDPQAMYNDDGLAISEWRIALGDTAKGKIIGDAEYFSLLKRIEKYIVDSNENFYLIKGISLAELKRLK